MKSDKYTSALIGAALAACAGFGAAASVATGLELSVNLWALLIGCLLISGIMALFFTLPKGGWILLGLCALTLVVLLPSRIFMEQLLGICHQAATFYSMAYGFPVPEMLQNAASHNHILPLAVIAGLISLTVTWTVIHRYPPALSVFLTVLPMISCFVVTDTVPGLLYLLIWLFAIIMLILTQLVRLRSSRSANRLAVMLASPVAIGLVLLLMVIPREDFQPPLKLDNFQSALDWISSHIPFIGQTSDGKLVINFISDFPDEVDLANLDDRYTGTAAVLEVTSDSGGELYLRIKDYDRYTGSGWSSSDRSERFSPPHISLTEKNSHISIRVLGTRTQALIPYYPAGDILLENGRLTTDSSDRHYSFSAVTLAEDWTNRLRNGIAFSTPPADPRYLELPAETAAEAGKILSKIIGLNQNDVPSTANRIASYVRRSAVYSLEVEQLPEGEDFAIWFLNESDTGYCVHFASAATVLLRAQGIPARLVEGFAFTAEANEATQVLQDDAHAWVEYYVDGVGWVVLDPTPSDGENAPVPTVKPTQPAVTNPTTRPTQPAVTMPSVKPTQPAATTPTTTVTRPGATGSSGSPTATGDVTADATGPTVADQEPASKQLPIWLVQALIWLVICASIPAVIFGQWFLRRYRKLQRMRKGPSNRRVLVCYRETKRICRALKTELPESLVALAEKARFSQHTLTETELASATAAYRASLQALHKGRWYQKLIWRFLLALY